MIGGVLRLALNYANELSKQSLKITAAFGVNPLDFWCHILA